MTKTLQLPSSYFALFLPPNTPRLPLYLPTSEARQGLAKTKKMAEAGGGDQPPSAPPPSLTEHFQHHDPSRQGGAWNALWEVQHTPWDRGGPSLALADLLRERPDLFVGGGATPPSSSSSFSKEGTTKETGRTKKTALVPGCGRGYDVLLLRSLGYDVVGLEVSERALAAARANADADAESCLLPGGQHGTASDDNDKDKDKEARAASREGRIVWALGNFFEDDWVREARDALGGGWEGQFDLIFDYTVST